MHAGRQQHNSLQHKGLRHRAPALFTKMCRPPKAPSAAATTRSGNAGSVTSPGTAIAVPQLLRMKSAVACREGAGGMRHSGALFGEYLHSRLGLGG